MDKMTKFQLASKGEKVDTPPVGSWIHFGSALWDSELTADVHLRFLRDYDWDYIKVMDDYRFPTADGVAEAETVDQLRSEERRVGKEGGEREGVGPSKRVR